MRLRDAVCTLVASGLLVAACGGAGASPSPATSPQEAATRLIGAIADDNGAEACALMITAAQGTFAQDSGAADCEGAVSSLSSQVTDKDAFRTMVPSGMTVTGDSAEVSGYCNDGWTHADGSRDTLDFSPNDLGTLTLRNTEDGWMLADYLSSEHYSTCG